MLQYRKLGALLILLAACKQTSVKFISPDRTNENADPTIVYADPNLIAMLPASTADCAAGGYYFVSYIDANQNGVFDSDETEKSRAVVCNGSSGANGSNGYGAGILVQSASSLSCPAGGSMITTFVDKNNDSILDADETTTSVSTLCNGSNGSDGAAATLTASLASASQCSAGGVVYTSLSSGETETFVVCNGLNGVDGQEGEDAKLSMGSVGSLVDGKSYSACHHDYLYFPDPSGGSRGWLTFRHQKNGSQDQGIASTGFQIWNVDIDDFALASEAGGVTYCNLSWNAVTRVLNYTVVDSSDGLQGATGQIQL